MSKTDSVEVSSMPEVCVCFPVSMDNSKTPSSGDLSLDVNLGQDHDKS